MKKYLFILSLTSIALLTACSSDGYVGSDDELTQEQQAQIIKAGMDSDVPISLSAGHAPGGNGISSVTRAPIESDANGKFRTPDDYMGVFLLAQQPQTTVASPGPVATDAIIWNTSTYSARMWNHPAKAEYATQWGGDDIDNGYTYVNFYDPATISGTPATKVYYYPYGNWYNYYFYTYYPRVADGSISVADNVVKASYTLNGSQDIIAGTATPPQADLAKGFCAKYFRDIKEAASVDVVPYENLPNMGLEHKLAQLRFFVKKDRTSASELTLKNLVLVDIPTEWDLVVADKSSTAKTGAMVSRSTTVTSYASPMTIKNMTIDGSGNATASDNNPRFDPADDNKYLNLTTDAEFVGYAMVPTSEMISTANSEQNRGFISPRFEVRCSYDGEEIPEYNTPISISLPASGSFKAGKVYNITLTIPVPTSVDARATLTQWATTNEAGSEDINMNAIY